MNKNVLPPTTKKVSMHISDRVNEEIRDKTLFDLNILKDSNEEVLSSRIKKLDYEWDTERFLETNAALLVLLSSIKGYVKNKNNCFLMTGAVSFFLLHHALFGWVPPFHIITNMGFRTAEEIIKEKTVIKFIRGDFGENNIDNIEEIYDLIEK